MLNTVKFLILGPVYFPSLCADGNIFLSKCRTQDGTDDWGIQRTKGPQILSQGQRRIPS